MAVEEEERSLEELRKEPVQQVDEIFGDFRRRRRIEDFRRRKNALFVWAVLASIGLIALVYFISPASSVKAISVEGGYYLSKDYIVSLSGLSLDSKYYLTLPALVQAKIQKDPMIQSCQVEMLDNNVVSIRVQEKKAVGYRYEDTPLILLEDGSTAELKSDYLSIIAKVPLITGFSTEEQTHLLTKAFSAIDRSMIESIAEVDQFSMNYDDEALKILMRDGGYFISSYYGLSMINSYNEIYTQLSDKSLCIFAEDSTKVAYAKKCPWNETETQLEYWQNADGSYITNKYGDKVVVHYYTDTEGNNYLDASGSPIRIPVDVYGEEVPDQNFEENWKAGYYDSGVFDASKVPATPAASAAAQNG